MATQVDGQDRNRTRSATGSKEQPVVSIVVPTRNEEGNIDELVARVEQVMPDIAMEIIFVDDSDDGTPEAIARVARTSSRAIRLVHRTGDQRTGGLGGAVVDGMHVASAPWVCVMDADLQPPPEVIESLTATALDERLDIVVASRFRDEGSVGNFGPLRRGASRLSSAAAGVF